MNTIDLEPGWLTLLHDCFDKDYMHRLRHFLQQLHTQGRVCYPPGSQIFNAFWQTPLAQVQVVILGQDPYHGYGQAHGLSFSVPDGVRPPPSLINIHKELLDDLGIDNSGKGNLEPWAQQGVLLLNSVLTVTANQAASHANQGWEIFTDEVIHRLADFSDNLVFILWGSYAQKKGAFIHQNTHKVIRSAHPSPLSAHNGFFGSKPFSSCNDYLTSHDKTAINWQL